MIVALDTNILIWGLQEHKPGAKSDLLRRAKILLRQLDEDCANVLVPSVVVAELLVGIPPEKHGSIVHELRKRFLCPSLDLHAASIAAELWQKHRRLPPKDQIKRSTLKADVLIIATAASAGAQRFYSHDPKCRRLARAAKLDAHDLPTHHENLFIDQEMRENP